MGCGKIHVERADQVFAANVEQRDRDRGVVDHFLFQSDAGLLHARGDEVSGEGGDVVGDALRKSCGQRAVRGIQRTTHQRVGISGEDLVVVVIGVVEEELASVMPFSVWMTEL